MRLQDEDICCFSETVRNTYQVTVDSVCAEASLIRSDVTQSRLFPCYRVEPEVAFSTCRCRTRWVTAMWPRYYVSMAHAVVSARRLNTVDTTSLSRRAQLPEQEEDQSSEASQQRESSQEEEEDEEGEQEENQELENVFCGHSPREESVSVLACSFINISATYQSLAPNLLQSQFLIALYCETSTWLLKTASSLWHLTTSISSQCLHDHHTEWTRASCGLASYCQLLIPLSLLIRVWR